ncbi:MAG: T9SS type A sorting domain-containing protein [Bacteroidales bacterium]|nr:T9SS type A sorting domain-containing protein [Bacteroidales bacterium]
MTLTMLNFRKILSSFAVAICAFTAAGQGIYLPLTDDFSSYTGIPDTALWVNYGCNVNTGYQFYPPSVGVVTMDILDSQGRIYEQANIYSFSADTLCSKSVRMDSLQEPTARKIELSDSVYLSFFIQPGGSMGNMWERIGSTPSVKDSVILQFYKSQQDTWNTVWSISGTDVETIYKQDSSYFIYVLLPLTDTSYFNSDFRFRFINYGSLDANPSYDYVTNKGQWNIDYIYLNVNRNWQDKYFRDISFVNPAVSLLKNYTSLPAKHYKPEYMKDSLQTVIVNLDSSALNSNYNFSIKDSEDNVLYSYNGGFENIYPYSKTHSFQTAQKHSNPALEFAFSPQPGKFSSYQITHVIQEGVGQDKLQSNDTVKFVQKFENYFAYDDATSESGFGIEPVNSSMLALGFDLLQTDTLYAVDIYFNAAFHDANMKPFVINIYNATQDSVARPDKLLYSTGKMQPGFDSLDKYIRYYTEQPVVLPAGRFFVALQALSSTYLNIGLDQNNDARGNMFEKRANQWLDIFHRGAPMIRPYFGYSTIGIENLPAQTENITCMPNPAKDEIYITGLQDNTPVYIYSITGRLLIKTAGNRVNVASLANGVYLVKVKGKTLKLIIAR